MQLSLPENWQGLEGRVAERLRRWTGLFWCLSLRGRALVLDQLVLPMLWHRLNTLVPAPGFLANLWTLVLEFFWPGLHWVSAGVLHLPLEEGGQGLKCLRTQVHVFSLQGLQRLLYGAGSPAWSVLVHTFLHRFRGLRYDRQLLYLHLRGLPRDLSGCRSSTRTSSGPGNWFRPPGLWRLLRGRISSWSPCYTTPSSVCRWWNPPRCTRGWSWQKSPE
ncbi:unnamed protein product [Natator depressus]